MRLLLISFYNIVLGALLVLLVGSGISSFYPEPTIPTSFPTTPCSVNVNTKGCTIYQILQNQQEIAYQVKDSRYRGVVGIIALVCLIGFFVLGVIAFYRLRIFSGGLFLGSLFTLFYAINQFMAASNTQYEFIALCVGILLGIVAGYLFFVREHIFSVK